MSRYVGAAPCSECRAIHDMDDLQLVDGSLLCADCDARGECGSCGASLGDRGDGSPWHKPDEDCRAVRSRAPSVPDPVADTARALAEKWERADREWIAAMQAGRDRKASDARVRREAVADAARACGPQVYAAWCALVTGDATRAPGVGRVD